MACDILVVDNEQDIRMLLKELLESKDLQVQMAENGENALAAITEHQPKLMICDISMPGITGFELVKTLRKKNFSCAVVMVTAHSEKDKIIEALQLGALDYIVKPFNPLELINMQKDK